MVADISFGEPASPVSSIPM